MYRIIVILLLCSNTIFGQTPDSVKIETLPDLFEEFIQINDNGGTVNFKGETAANDVVKLHIRMNREQKTVTGYRIQIFSGNSYDYSIERLQQMKTDFETEFPDIPVYLNYFDPDLNPGREFPQPSGLYSDAETYPS